MSMRAPCLSAAVAMAYADPDCSSSASSTITLKRPLIIQRKRRRQMSMSRTVLSSLFLLLLALPIASAIFDPGHSDEPDEAPTPKVRPILSSSSDSTLSLISPKGQPVSLHPGCKRTSDLFDNVCHNPWSPFSTSHRKSHSAGHSELVICPVGERTDNGEKERVFAITGTITLPESTFADVEAASSSPISSATLGDKEAYWPKPGDEGFWRQRDGELEWVPTEVRALLEPDLSQGGASPAINAKVEAAKEEGSAAPDVAHAEEYHAWSESVGGEESKTWLSFEQWREKHLAEEREQEKQRIAAGRKQKSDKAKEKKVAQGQAGNATEKPVETHLQGALEEANATKPGDISEELITSGSLEGRPEKHAEDYQAPLGDNAEAKHSDPPAEEAVESVVEPSVVKLDTSQDTGAIPAITDPSPLLSDLKHRWNFASFDCAAVVHRANPSAKFTSSILSEKKDRYMLSPCPQGANDPQFVVVELCDEISVDTIVLANYEFFSRMFKRFRVRVARNLNGGEADWYDIGTFRARNVRGLQVFKTLPPKADSRFFRYVRIDILEHYGSEYYCPISLLRVYGLTQMDDYIREEEEMRRQKEAELTLADSESAEDEEDKEEEATEVPEGASDPVTSASTESQPLESSKSDQVDQVVQPPSSAESPSSVPASSSVVVTSTVSSEQPSIATGTTASSTAARGTPSSETALNATELNVTESINKTMNLLDKGAEGALSKPVINVDKMYANASDIVQGSGAINASAANVTATLQSPLTNSTEKSPPRAVNETSTESVSASSVNATTASVSMAEAKERSINVTSSPPPAAVPASSSEASKPAGNGQQQQNSGGSESIYRTITKRLNTLEMNATLSLQYMEHSRQQLGEVFGRMERNQREKIAEMLKELNASNWRQIESLKRRQQVDLQQAIFEFDKHRQQTDAERRQLLAQVHILSNEVILEKRFGIAQLVLLLGLFVFMALTRGSRAAPLIHQGIARISSRSSSGFPTEAQNSPPRSIRTAPALQGRFNIDARGLASPSPAAPRHRPFLTPRLDKHNRGLDRAVPLRGGKSASARKAKSPAVLTFSPIRHRKSVNSISSIIDRQEDRSDSAISSQHEHDTSPLVISPFLRPVIKLDTATNLPEAQAELETPIYRVAVRPRTFQRESTPTNLSEARQLDIPRSSSTLSESYGSDWGTERSDDEESHTSYGFKPGHGDCLSISSASLSPSPRIPPISTSIHRIEESDAEEDSPKWNSVKSRRPLKRPTSSSGNNGDWQSHTNGLNRIHTPPNHHLIDTPTKRSFSPFHKNAEIEIN